MPMQQCQMGDIAPGDEGMPGHYPWVGIDVGGRNGKAVEDHGQYARYGWIVIGIDLDSGNERTEHIYRRVDALGLRRHVG